MLRIKRKECKVVLNEIITALVTASEGRKLSHFFSKSKVVFVVAFWFAWKEKPRNATLQALGNERAVQIIFNENYLQLFQTPTLHSFSDFHRKKRF